MIRIRHADADMLMAVCDEMARGLIRIVFAVENNLIAFQWRGHIISHHDAAFALIGFQFGENRRVQHRRRADDGARLLAAHLPRLRRLRNAIWPDGCGKSVNRSFQRIAGESFLNQQNFFCREAHIQQTAAQGDQIGADARRQTLRQRIGFVAHSRAASNTLRRVATEMLPLPESASETDDLCIPSAVATS